MKKLLLLIVLLSSVNLSFGDSLNAPAPDFRLKDYSGKPGISLSDLLDGKTVVVLNFFDTNCAPCKKEIPKLNSVLKKVGGKAKMYMVCLDEKAEDVLPAYLKEFQVDAPILLDPLGIRAGEKYGVIKFGAAEIPQIFVIGKDGKIRSHYKGFHENIDELLLNDIEKFSAEEYVKAKENDIEIIYAGSSNGLLESCDCPQNPFGGMIRKVSLINKLKNQNPNAIVVDSGDYFPPRPDKNLSDYSVQMIKMIDYDLISIGDQEILQGMPYLKEKANEIPFYSSNLTTCDEKMCYPFNKERYIIKKVGDVRIAVLGVINPDIFFLFPKDKMKNVKVINTIEYLTGIIPEIKKEADMIVLVSHCGDEEDSKIAANVSGIDLIVGGHSQTFYKDPLKVNNTLIVQGGQNSHRVGDIKFKLDDKKNIVSAKNEYTLLNKDIPDDPKARALTEKYKKELKEKARELVK
jgi:peroxiredoxin